MKILSLGRSKNLIVDVVDADKYLDENEIELSELNKNFAKDLIDSFEEHWSVNLLNTIHIESARRILEHWERFFPQRLEELKYKKMKELVVNNER